MWNRLGRAAFGHWWALDITRAIAGCGVSVALFLFVVTLVLVLVVYL